MENMIRFSRTVQWITTLKTKSQKSTQLVSFLTVSLSFYTNLSVLMGQKIRHFMVLRHSSFSTYGDTHRTIRMTPLSHP